MSSQIIQSLENMRLSDESTSLKQVGIDFSADGRSGTFILVDSRPVCVNSELEGLEILPLGAALERYDWLRNDYYWRAVPKDLDDVTARCADQHDVTGYFVRVKQGARATVPCQAAFYIGTSDTSQWVHNIIIVEDGAELNMITGCTTGYEVHGGYHNAISEHYIGNKAKLTNTMVHSWDIKTSVHPRSGTIVEDNGVYISNYVSLRPSHDIKTLPQVRLIGKNASAKFTTIILSSPGTRVETGGDIRLEGEDSSAELAHRAISNGGHVYQSGMLTGLAKCRGHVDCSGLLSASEPLGLIESIPGLTAKHPDAQLSHEASIGRIKPEEVEYLRARGMEEREAISVLIRGFLGSDIPELGPYLDERIAEIAESIGHHG